MSRSRSIKRSRLIGVVAGAAVCAALVSISLPASASVSPHDPPVRAGIPTSPSYDHTYNYPNYDPLYEVQPVQQSDGLDTTSVTLGALGGIALAGAGLGIAFGLQRRRDHSAVQST
jgi:hypothetical protein